MAAFRDLEILVAKIQRYLAPNAKVQHNVLLDGRKSETKRQIDVLVEQMVGQYKMRIVIDSKDLSRPMDVTGVEQFAGLVDDVGAHKGVLVSPLGFTKAAKSLATKLQIELYSPFDTDPHDWQVQATMPFLVDFRKPAFSFTLTSSHAGPFAMRDDFPTSTHIYDKDGNDLGTAIDAAADRWHEGAYEPEPAEQRGLMVFDVSPIFMDDGHGGRAEISIKVNLLIEQEFRFGQLPISDVSGFRDEIGGGVITRGFTTGNFNPIVARETWLKIETREAAPYPPMMSVVILI